MELWAHNIEFKGFDVRFCYDKEKFKTSDVDTNEETTDITKFFKFETEFQGALEMFNGNEESNNGIVRGILSFFPPIQDTEHIITREDSVQLVSSKGDDEPLLLGKMSFKMSSNEVFDIEGFKLAGPNDGTDYQDTEIPPTGIWINIDGTYRYENQSTFIFEDATASKDADLLNIEVSSEQESEEEPDSPIKTTYELEPEFEKDKNEYTVTLYDYIDEVDITAKQSDVKANMKIKVPKRDDDGNLVYKDGGMEIDYEEKDLENNTPLSVTLNKLGEPDTEITITVTAEDGNTTKEYKVTIKRPYGTIKGQIHTQSSIDNHTADIRIYKSEDVSKEINWGTVKQGDTDNIHEQLLELPHQEYKADVDGSYQIYVIPGRYDVLIDRPGYIDEIYTKREVTENEEENLGEKELTPGDVNKDGVIQIIDLSILMNAFSTESTDSAYETRCDFNEDSEIQIIDLSILMSNFSKYREIN